MTNQAYRQSVVLAATLLAAASLHAFAAEKAAKKAPQSRPPLTEAERMKHIPPLPPADKPLVDANVVFQEVDGAVVIEAEHFHQQTRHMIRRWYLNSPQHTPTAKPDGDPVIIADAGGGAYLEALPDTFVTDDDRAIDGLNLGLHPGAVAVLHYKVHFSKPGRYYLWTRMRSDDEEDNTLNAGLNDEWPASAKCLQFQKHTKAWQWGNVIRDPKGPAFPRLLAWLDVPSAGVHTVMYSMREDGCSFDRFLLTMDKDFAKPVGVGPATTAPKSGQLPQPFTRSTNQP
jgi:hypothetical protein